MNHNLLALFRAVAEAGGFSRAVKAVHISQPAISAQVAELEAQLGSSLFERLPRGVRLTAAGELLLGYARRLVALKGETERAMGELLGLQRGRLAVGASTTIGVYLLPEILGEFHRRYPAVALELKIENAKQIMSRLLDGTLDVGLAEGAPPTHADLETGVFREDELVAIGPPGHPRFTGETGALTARQLCAEPMIVREAGSGTREVIERALARRNLRLTRPAMTLGSTEAIKGAVAAGLGLAVVSRLALEVEVQAGHLAVRPVSDLGLRRPLHRLLARRRPPSAAARAFRALLAESDPHPGDV